MNMVAKRTVMTLYCNENDCYCQLVRFVLAEKGKIDVEYHHVKTPEQMEVLASINPYQSLPTLVDRDLVLYPADNIIQYLDERFPHPPLLPVYPVARAESRKMIYRIKRDWYGLMRIVEGDDAEKAAEARHHLRDTLTSISPLFADKPFFMSEDFTLVDCYLGPLLWRLSDLGIELPAQAKGVKEYAARIFQRPAFQSSLTDVERELQAA